MTIIREQLDVYNKSWCKVYNHIDDQLLLQLYDQVHDQVRDQFQKQVYNQISDQLNEDLKANAT